MADPPELTLPSRFPHLQAGASRSLAVRAEPILVGLAGFVLASAVAASDGGYFSDSWAWVAFVSLFLSTLRLILAPALPLRRLDWGFVAGIGGFAAWVALSNVWAPAITPSIDETIRDVSYAAAVLLLLLIVRRRTVNALLFGAFAGVLLISTYSLLTRLHPDWVGDWDPGRLYRLSGTIGYWNGLGVYAAMGVLLALGLVARSESRVMQAVAGAAPPILLPTMLFTFSRGAWLALAAGLIAVLLLDARRLQLVATALALAPWSAIVLLVAWQSDNLTSRALTLEEAANEGGALLVWIIVMAIVSALVAVAFRLADARVDVPAPVRRTISRASIAALVVAIIAAFAVYGAPWTLADRAADAFNSRSGGGATTDVTSRLFSFSANGRVEAWRVSLDQFRDQPIGGDGAGSFTAAWNLNRPYESVIQDAHSLYIEVLGELGLIGLAVLLVALAVPVVAAIRARRSPYVAGAFAMYAAFLAHAAVDWDWELAGVTLVGLIAAVALVVSARGEDREDAEPRRMIRIGLPAVTAAVAVLALGAVLSTVPLNRARDSYSRLDFIAAASQAQKAADWAPWSSDALDVLGRAQLGQGQLGKARLSFQRAVEKSPNNWELWRDLAAASPPAEARAALLRAQALSPLESEIEQIQHALAQTK